MNAEHYPAALRVIAGLGLAGLLAGCSNGPSWGAWSQRPSEAEVAAVLERTANQPVTPPPAPHEDPIAVVATRDQ